MVLETFSANNNGFQGIHKNTKTVGVCIGKFLNILNYGKRLVYLMTLDFRDFEIWKSDLRQTIDEYLQ